MSLERGLPNPRTHDTSTDHRPNLLAAFPLLFALAVTRSASQISSEKPGISFESSAASNGNAERASPQHNGGKATSADGSNPPQSREDLGGLRQRKEANKKM